MQTIAFAGGGTAGHVMPNIALINKLKADYNCVYIGGDGMEKNLCREHEIEFYAIDTVKLRRDAIVKNIAVPFKLIGCVRSASRALDTIKPSLIFSKGGYAALPVVLAAGSIPVISHESDFSPGLATKLAKNKSELVLCAFETCAKKFKNGKYCGTPLNASLYSGKADKAAYGLSGSKPVLAVVGGSSGAATLNACVVKALPELSMLFDIIHVTGKNKTGGEKSPSYTPMEFESNMARLYATSDIVLTRAGANALAECIALSVPTLAVPLEKASRGDQLQNADYYRDKGAIAVLREQNMTEKTLVKAVVELYRKRADYIKAMSALKVDGTDEICKIIKDTIARHAVSST